jgi:HEAT repeat protein
MQNISALNGLLADLTSGDEARAEAAVPEIVALGEEAFPSLHTLLESNDSDIRWWAVRTLSQNLAPPTAWLLQALQDPAPEVRQCAALGLCSHPNDESIPSLITALADADTMVSNLATNAVVAVGAEAVPFLLESLKTSPQAARINAMRALADIRDYRAVQAMMSALEEDSMLMQHWAEEGLERLGLNMVYLDPD